MHYIFLIHGIGDGTPSDDFSKFEENLAAKFCKERKLTLDAWSNRFKVIPVLWDDATADAELSIFKMSFDKDGVAKSDRALVGGSNFLETALGLFDTSAWRYFMTFFVGDAIAYVDEQDNGIRRRVWETISEQFKDFPDDEIPEYSIFGHSLGSVIAYDYMYSILEKGQLFDFKNKPQLSDARLKGLADGFRNLVTFGSPIALFWMRWGDVWPNDYAKLTNPIQGDRRWLNFWCHHDLVAYPLRGYFSGKPSPGNIEDIKVNTGIAMPWAHTGYWKSRRMVSEISKLFP